MHTYIHAYVHMTNIHSYIQVLLSCSHTLQIHAHVDTCIHTYSHTYIHTASLVVQPYITNNAHVHTCSHTYIHAYIHTNKHTHRFSYHAAIHFTNCVWRPLRDFLRYIYAYILLYAYIRMHVCTHMYACIHTCVWRTS
jgi:hypothetical protein